MPMPFSAQLESLRDRFERLSERERTLVSLFGVSAFLMVTLITGYLVTDALSAREERNADMRQALRDIDKHRDGYRRAKERFTAVESRLAGPGFAFGGYLETAAKEAGIEIPESNERAPKPAGKTHVERSIELRLNRVKLEALAGFMRRVESGQTLVAVTALSVRTRDDKHQELDVELTVSTWERAPEKKAQPKKGDKPSDGTEKGDEG